MTPDNRKGLLLRLNLNLSRETRRSMFPYR